MSVMLLYEQITGFNNILILPSNLILNCMSNNKKSDFPKYCTHVNIKAFYLIFIENLLCMTCLSEYRSHLKLLLLIIQ